MQTLVEATAVEHATGELVDDQHLTVADDVVLVAVEEFLDLDRVVQVADQRRVRGLVEVVDTELILDEFDARLVHADRLLLDVDLVVDVTLEQRRDTRELGVPLARSLGGTRDDQRCPGLVDQDRVDLVDDGEVVAALHEILEGMRHVVAQVVKAELVVGAVGDVGVVGDLALLRGHPGQDHRGVETEEAVDASHPLGVTLCQVVVDRDDVHAVARQRVEVRGQHTGQGLALTGLHLGDVAVVQRGATHDLHVEVLLVENAPCSFAGHRECLGQHFVERLALGDAILEFAGLGLQFVVGERCDLVFQRLDVRCDRIESLDHAAFADAQ